MNPGLSVSLGTHEALQRRLGVVAGTVEGANATLDSALGAIMVNRTEAISLMEEVRGVMLGVSDTLRELAR